MTFRLDTSIEPLLAENCLKKNQVSLQKAFERLSSGLRARSSEDLNQKSETTLTGRKAS